MERFYKLQSFYHRDVYFVYGERNVQSYADALTQPSNGVGTFYYEVDFLDDEITQYDILPTLGPELVSAAFVEQFRDVIGQAVQFTPAEICDAQGNINRQFYGMQVLNRYACVDFTRSQISHRTYGQHRFLAIHSLVIDASKVIEPSIFSLQEKLGYILVNQARYHVCQSLRGVECLPLD
ncbi:imm11 family protein [Shewanella decolorationis]|uniref:imm11 family protein n=1 Tax=Shewanella decolorationis TaxID=256839 RepID=UPI001056EF24|nr:DUF1629 domain-containing protein [Shewanella decolorationis]